MFTRIVISLLDKNYSKLRVNHQINFQTNLVKINIYEDDQILLSTFLKLNYCFPYYQIDFRGSSVKGITRDSINLELNKISNIKAPTSANVIKVKSLIDFL